MRLGPLKTLIKNKSVMERLEIQAKAQDAADVPQGIWETIGQDLLNASGDQAKAKGIYDSLSSTMANDKDVLRKDMRIAAKIHDAPTPTLSSFSPQVSSAGFGPRPGAVVKPPPSSSTGSRHGTASNTTKPTSSGSSKHPTVGTSTGGKAVGVTDGAPGTKATSAPGLWGFHIVEDPAAEVTYPTYPSILHVISYPYLYPYPILPLI